jgi:bifunctional enzyme CysN/CysC
MPWYTGPALLAALESLADDEASTAPIRFPVHDVYRRDEERILVGTVAGAPLAAGTTLAFAPTGDRARVTRIVRFPASDAPARVGEAIGITLDAPIFVGPGHVASTPDALPHIVQSVEATIFWLDATTLTVGEHVRMRCGTRDVTVVLEAIAGTIDIETFAEHPALALTRNDIARVTLRGLQPLVVDTTPAALARFALYRGDAVGGGGIITQVARGRSGGRRSSPDVTSSALGVSSAERSRRAGHRGLVVWLTGLPSSGKSTLAAGVEAALFADGWFTYVLDGDNLRTGLNGDLGFGLADRSENVRRTGEVAALFADAGCIAIVAQVSPLRADRARARAATPDAFVEIYVRADLAVCEARDVKGLYRRARDGDIADFTGVSSPYEEPLAPDLVIETARIDIAAGIGQILELVRSVAQPGS